MSCSSLRLWLASVSAQGTADAFRRVACERADASTAISCRCPSIAAAASVAQPACGVQETARLESQIQELRATMKELIAHNVDKK